MKIVLQKLFLLGALLLFTSSVSAGDSYFGLGYHLGTYEEKGLSEANPTALQLKAGKYFGKNFAVEGRYLFGMGPDTVDILGDAVDLKLRSALSVMGKGTVPLSKLTNIYVLLGLTYASFESKKADESDTNSDIGLSYGVGFEQKMGDNLVLQGDYVLHLDESNYTYSAFTIGFATRF